MFRAVLVFVSFLITPSSVPKHIRSNSRKTEESRVVRAVKLHAVSCFTLWRVVETMSVKRIVIADLNQCTCQTLSENIQASHDENSNPARPLRSASNQLEDWSLRWPLGWSHILVKGKGVEKNTVYENTIQTKPKLLQNKNLRIFRLVRSILRS